MSRQLQEDELKRILREIYEKYHELSGVMFYYKLKGDVLRRFIVFDEQEVYDRISDTIFNPDLMFALFIDSGSSIEPFWECSESRRFSDEVHVERVIKQFFDYFYLSQGFKSFITSIIGDKDPISQIFTYNKLQQTSSLHHVYICPSVFLVEPYGSDPTSIFNTKKGIVAYCSSLESLFRMGYVIGIDGVDRTLWSILSRAYEKLAKSELGELWEKDKTKACDINLIKTIIHDEIEEAERIMRKYNIIRVAFPLDSISPSS